MLSLHHRAMTSQWAMRIPHRRPHPLKKPAAAQPVPLQHGYHGHTHGNDKAPGTKPPPAPRYGATKRTTPPPDRGELSNMPPSTRNMVEGTYTHADFMQNNTNPIGAPLRYGHHGHTHGDPVPWGDQNSNKKPAAKPVPLHHGYHGHTHGDPVPWGYQKPATHSNKKPTAKQPPLPADSTEDDEYLKADPPASTGNVAAPPPPAASTGNVAVPLQHGYHGHTHGDKAPGTKPAQNPAAAQPLPLKNGYHGHAHGDKAPGTK